MRIQQYNELIRLYRKANDLNQTPVTRQQARKEFESRIQSVDDVMKQIIQDAIAVTTSTSASFFYTCRAAALDYSRTDSWLSAANTFFHVATTRLNNPAPIEEQSTQEVEQGSSQDNSFS